MSQNLEPGGCYHIYNRAHGAEKMFRNRGNYHFFLLQFQKHIHPICDTFCYCLMPNHFHFLIKFKEVDIIRARENYKQETEPSNYLSKQFYNFFSSYTQAFNKQHKRKGGLFMRPFKRKKVTTEPYLIHLIKYIHLNPVQAGMVESPELWIHSSYHCFFSENETFISKGSVLNYFDDFNNFIYIHKP